ncbi:hypothetical protein BJ742DRAFT_835740 [Cladochytrium replicatum]|nr:hypothetical protein BJ742DRAFT_835740 [Cladochytrium replicatum]
MHSPSSLWRSSALAISSLVNLAALLSDCKLLNVINHLTVSQGSGFPSNLAKLWVHTFFSSPKREPKALETSSSENSSPIASRNSWAFVVDGSDENLIFPPSGFELSFCRGFA